MHASRHALGSPLGCACCRRMRAGDQHGNIRVWDLTANACSCELVPEVGTAVRSISVALDGSLVVAANNQGVRQLQNPPRMRAWTSAEGASEARRWCDVRNDWPLPSCHLL